jgi:N-acetylmuramoyl-L-alanine amidase/putative methionine-R-sulfoxide reductase with GAF domain
MDLRFDHTGLRQSGSSGAVDPYMATNPSNTDPLLKVAGTGGVADPLENASAGEPADQREALQALLAFSTLHDQIRRKRVEEARRYVEGVAGGDDTWGYEKFVLDEVLQLVAERAQAITAADGIAIALAEGEEIICRASAGSMAPDRGMRLDSRAGFSGTCFRTARIVRCDDSESDPRVNVEACRRLGTRSMVAVPLLGQQNVVGLLEAFSTEPFGFSDADVRSLNLLAELILAALRPEEEDRIVRAAKVAAVELHASELESLRHIPLPPIPPAVEPAQESVPLEFSKEDIAPSLYEDTRRHKFVPALGVLGMVAVLLAGVIWWKSAPRALSRGLTDQRQNQGFSSRGDPGQNQVVSSTGDSRQNQVVSSTGDSRQNQVVSSTGDSSTPASSAVTQVAPPLPAVSASGMNSGPSIVSAVVHRSDSGVSTVVIDLQGPVQYRKNRLPSPERIYFDLLDTALAPGLNGQVIEVKDGLINRIRVAQPADKITRVVLETKSGSNFWDTLEQNPHRLVIEVRGAEALKPEVQPKPDLTASPVKQENAQAPSPASRDLNAPRAQGSRLRVVIDAGHGGWDLGTVGRGGLLEKTIVLDVAQNLGKMLESRLGCEVIFTRKDDNYVSLEERAEIANHAQADLFISVHANYSSLTSARGVETYYSSFFSPPEAREIEYRENATAANVTLAKLSGRALKQKVEESRKLAASVQHALYGALASQNRGIRNRGVREASFVVLTGTEMPSILAEISFVSSPTDEEKLQSTEYREQIAGAIFKGVENFASTAHRVKIASNVAPSTGQ